MPQTRLQKVMADAGLASRRQAEVWIREGRVRVNGKVVTQLGTKVDPEKDHLVVDGRRLARTSRHAYYLFHKPKNVMVTRLDPEGRPMIYDYLQKIPERVFPAGRLDFDSEGLLLLTNDGALTQQLTHPRTQIPKIYEVKIKGVPTPEQIQVLRRGVRLEEGMAFMAKVVLEKKMEKNSWLQITLTEGKRRQIRRMLQEVGLETLRLVRISIGPLRLGKLLPGRYRPLTPAEKTALHALGNPHTP